MNTIGIEALESEILNLKLRLSFREYLLNEAKQVDTIYHFTTLAHIESIIKSNKLVKGKEQYISVTRDYQLPNEKGYFNTGEYIVRLSFDGDKISENIKIIPVKDNKYNDEREEGILNDLSLKYLKQIDIITDYTWFSKTMVEAVYEKIKKTIQNKDTPINIVKKWQIVK